MGKKSIIDLRFPVGGVNKQYGYQSQPPFTTPDAMNVRPQEVIEGRERGGSRPGCGKAYYNQLGSGAAVRMLGAVSYIVSDGLTYWEDSFNGSALDANWAVANWGTYVLPTIFPNDYADAAYNTQVGAVRTALSGLDTAQAYQLDLFVVPYMGSHHGKYQIFGRMNDTTPVATTDGFVVELVHTGSTGAYTATLKTYAAGVETAYTLTAGNAGRAEAGWLSVLYTPGTPNVKVYWLGTLVGNQNVTLGAGAGNRFGFGMECTVAGGVALADSFRVQYKTNTKAQSHRRLLVASAGGLLYKEDYYNTLAAVSSNLTLASDRLLRSCEYLQKLYIADNANPRLTGTADGVAGTTFDDANIADWTTYGIDPHDDVVVITNGTGSVVNGTYTIASVASGAVTLNSAAGTGTCSFRIERAPKVYDPAAGTLTLWSATTGQVPTGCPLICTYRSRLVLAGHPAAPHAWYMSRTADALDFDYSADDTDGGRAVAGTQIDGGQIGQPITALIPHSDDYLLIGCLSSLWIVRGDPAMGGSIDNLSHSIGVVSAAAWCAGPAGERSPAPRIVRHRRQHHKRADGVRHPRPRGAHLPGQRCGRHGQALVAGLAF
jgi:hypothetical protein